MQHWGSTQLLTNLLRGFGLTCRIHGLPYEYRSLWPSSLLCLLCDWSFLASAGWRSALHLLPSSHQIRTGSKERKVRKDTKTEAPGMGGGKPIFELFSGIQGEVLYQSISSLAVCHKSSYEAWKQELCSQRPKRKANKELGAENNSLTSLMTAPAMDRSILYFCIR